VRHCVRTLVVNQSAIVDRRRRAAEARPASDAPTLVRAELTRTLDWVRCARVFREGGRTSAWQNHTRGGCAPRRAGRLHLLHAKDYGETAAEVVSLGDSIFWAGERVNHGLQDWTDFFK
jgi:hypothetical protein